jgi:hypothetical protein
MSSFEFETDARRLSMMERGENGVTTVDSEAILAHL